MKRLLEPALVCGLAGLIGGCGGGSAPASAPPTSNTVVANGPAVSIDKNAYPVFPDADAGADPSVPAEQGGRGFTGEGWETNTNYELIGDPRAVKGGVYREYQLNFPGTLRILGPDVYSFNIYNVGMLVYETLLLLHPTTLDYIPALATHWQISPDRMTYRFRIDPNARWADGESVTAEDVVATWSFVTDKGLQDPSHQIMFAKFEKPVAESKYIVRVTSKELSWQNFLNFCCDKNLFILPSHVLKGLNGARYLKEYNFKLIPGSGPYVVNEADVVKGRSISLRRRPNYWAAKQRRNVGTGNFDEIRETVVRDQNLAFEMFKKGDLDAYYVNISREWVQELDFDKVQQGLIQKRKVFNNRPSGIQGLAFNMRKAPYDDVRVRKALHLLLNRDALIQTLYLNEYVPMNSYFPGGIYENPNNPKNTYDPQTALKLLAEAGWKDRDSQGRLTRSGRPLVVEVLYPSKSTERFLTVFQEDLRKVGIGLNLRLVTYETLIKLLDERMFDVVSIGWVVPIFPDPEPQYRSTLADQNASNNVTGLKDQKVDVLIDRYNLEFDQQKRIPILREIDGLLANQYPYILGWDAPFERIAFWNKFGYPRGILTRIGEYFEMNSLWWIDSRQEQALKEAMANPSTSLEIGETDDRYWLEYAKRQAPPAPPQ